MGIRSVLARPLAAFIHKQNKKWIDHPEAAQQAILKSIVAKAQNTEFGKGHGFSDIRSHDDFSSQVPVRDYEGLTYYFNRVADGMPDILWPGKPAYLAKTSGTTSGTKYIPITKDSIPNHINSARNALLAYVYETGKSKFLDGSLIFLSGSPELELKGGINTGRLSGIVNHHVPGYLRSNQMPSYATNCIEDWETKLDRIIDETIQRDMTLISGIPPWVQMYFDRLMARKGNKIKDIFPNFSLFVYGGVNFEPYRAKLEESIGRKVDSIETYPASEGFIAYQDSQTMPGLLLNAGSGIFFEFIPTDQYFDKNPPRLTVSEVEIGINYAIVLSSNAGLWGYSIGDTVKFISKNPYRLVFTGRIKHFISAFGEHVIAEEVEKAMRHTLEKHREARIVEFTVAPMVSDGEAGSRHQWLIEFDQAPENQEFFALTLDAFMRQANAYYADLITGNILRRLEIVPLQRGAFINYMKSKGKLGGQNKVPRLSNDRNIAEDLVRWRE